MHYGFDDAWMQLGADTGIVFQEADIFDDGRQQIILCQLPEGLPQAGHLASYRRRRIDLSEDLLPGFYVRQLVTDELLEFPGGV